VQDNIEPPRRYSACRFDDKEKGVRAAVSLDRFENELLQIALRYCPPLPTPRGNIFVTIWAKLGTKMCAYLLIVNIYALWALI
jgi:hypothetical protein